MAENSSIEWTHHTFNPWRGCTKVSAGCANCYAETLSGRNPRSLGQWGPRGTRVVAAESYWREPLKWNKAASLAGERHNVFCASLADVFEDWDGVMTGPGGGTLHDGRAWYAETPYVEHATLRIGRSIVTIDDVRIRLLSLIRRTPALNYLLLTKRPELVMSTICRILRRLEHVRQDDAELRPWLTAWIAGRPPANVWLGTSVEDQAAADERIPRLLQCPAAVRFLSMEPLLEPVRFSRLHHHCPTHDFPGGFCSSPCPDLRFVDWVIVGGESGPKARPMHPEWVRSIRDQCQAAGVPFFFKQWGEWIGGSFDTREGKFVSIAPHDVTFWTNPGHPILKAYEPSDSDWRLHASARVGKKAAGRLLDGRERNEMPSTVEAAR